MVAISDAGLAGSLLALRRDGTVTAFGRTTNDLPAGLTNIISIAQSGAASPFLALKTNGEVVAWGWIGDQPAKVPKGLSNVVSIAIVNFFCLAVTTNQVVAERFR